MTDATTQYPLGTLRGYCLWNIQRSKPSHKVGIQPRRLICESGSSLQRSGTTPSYFAGIAKSNRSLRCKSTRIPSASNQAEKGID